MTGRDSAGFQSVAGERARRASSPGDLGADAQWEEWRSLTPPMPIDEGALDDLLSMPSVGTEATLDATRRAAIGSAVARVVNSTSPCRAAWSFWYAG